MEMKNSSDAIANIITAIAIVFLGGLLCFLAWNGWAWEFNLPKFSYWHWVATYAAFRLLIGHMKQGK